MNLISNILYWISTGLLVPVIVLLIFFFFRSILLVGGFFSQYLQERKISASLNSRIKALTIDALDEFKSSLPAEGCSIVETYATLILECKENTARIDLLLNEYELEADRNLSTPKILTKMGPILGLMGTLIPMGPALVGLATGDISSMAYNMQVAFATTVVGLVISAIGFTTQQAKERWFVRNLSLLEYLGEIVKQSQKQNK